MIKLYQDYPDGNKKFRCKICDRIFLLTPLFVGTVDDSGMECKGCHRFRHDKENQKTIDFVLRQIWRNITSRQIPIKKVGEMK